MEPGLTRRGALTATAAALLTACSTAVKPRRAAPTVAPPDSRQSPTPPAPPVPSIVRHAASGRPEVALTFHGSGDPELAVRLLTEAEHASAPVTVLAVGSWLEQHPELAKRILAGGHALGNHTYTHPTLHRLPRAQVDREITRCATLLHRLTGSVGAAFRPSGGPTINATIVAAARAAGYPTVVGYDVDPSDNLDPGSAAVTRRVLADVRAGSIVSLHLGHAGTVEALPHMLSGLAARGLRPVTVPRLLAPA